MGFDQTPPNEPTDYTPVPKVAAAGIGGSIAVIVIWIAQTYLNVVIPAEVAASIATVASFVAGYLKRP
jgi:uncharacterized membrane-anchored protein